MPTTLIAQRRSLLGALATVIRLHHREWADDPRRLFQQVYPWLRWWASPGPDSLQHATWVRAWADQTRSASGPSDRSWARQVSCPAVFSSTAPFRHQQVSRAFFASGDREILTVGRGTKLWEMGCLAEKYCAVARFGSVHVYAQSMASGGVPADSPSALSQGGQLALVTDIESAELAPGTCRELAVFDLASGERRAQWITGSNPLCGITWSPDGARLATTTVDGSARLWSAPAGILLLELLEPYPHGGGWQDIEYPMPGFDWPTRPTFSADGRLLAIGREDRCFVWDLASGEQVACLEDPKPSAVLEGTRWYGNRGVRCVAFSLDGERLAIGMWDGTIRVWAFPGPTPGPLLAEAAGIVTDLAWDPRRNCLAACHALGDVRLWTLVAKPRSRRVARCQSPPTSVTFSGDGSQLLVTELRDTFHVCATGDEHASRSYWPVPTSSAGQDRIERSIAWGRGGKIACSGPGGYVRIVSRDTGDILGTIAGDRGDASALAWHPRDDRLFVGTTDGGLGWADPDRTSPTWLDLPGLACVLRVQLSADGDTLLAQDNRGRLWMVHVPSRAVWSPPEPFQFGVAALSPDGSRLVCVARRDPGAAPVGHAAEGALVAHVWILQEGQDPDHVRYSLPVDEVVATAVAFSPDQRHAWIAGGGFDIRVPGQPFCCALDVETGRVEPAYAGALERDLVMSLDVHPSGDLVALYTARTKEIIIWSLLEQSSVRRLPFLHSGRVRGLRWSPCGRFLAAGGRAGVAVWDLRGQRLAATVGKEIRGNLDWTADSLTLGFIDGDGEPCIVWVEPGTQVPADSA